MVEAKRPFFKGETKVTMKEFIELANSYRDLGDAVQEQLKDFLAGGESALADQNPDALKMIEEEFLRLVRAGTDRELACEAHEMAHQIKEFLAKT